ncbi:hypothetical protein J2S74_000663 [Evansella vedderi]|uniref:Uncharacterized protein n=1 Tax=Evansella vedderi TaxID=38282 RepID=A0ABT9ZPX9_9BACI|nr:hypothetical protein [Evansella vedderi]MDQ0253291.1 hypothetical protein [Evansella vedderi]
MISLRIYGKNMLFYSILSAFLLLAVACSGESKAVLAEVDETKITSEMVEFQQLLSLLHIELVRTEGKSSMDEATFAEMNRLWEEQERQVTHINYTLTSMIRTLAMAKLAEQKGHIIPEEVVLEQTDQFLNQYRYDVTFTLIEEFGEERFVSQLEKYTKDWLLARLVYNDMIEDIQGKYPEKVLEEIHYLANEQYEDLLVAQMETLNVTIYSLEGY